MENGFNVRVDFKEVEKEIFALHNIGLIFKENEADWSYLKNGEDFESVYNLKQQYREKLTQVYAAGRAFAQESYFLLVSINNDFSTYPTLTSVVFNLKKYWFNEERIKELENIYNSSKTVIELNKIQIYSIEAMNILFEKQLALLKEVCRIIIMLENSDLYKRENPQLINSIRNSHNAPEYIKNFTWYLSFLKHRPVLAIFVGVVLIVSWKFDLIYDNSKHFINVQILHKEIDGSEKIKVGHIFNVGRQLVSLFYDMGSNNTDLSNLKIDIKGHFSALKFKDDGLINYNNIDIEERLKNYGDVRAKFEGFIDAEYPKYTPLYRAGVNIITAIHSKNKDYLIEFDKDWKQYQENVDYTVPKFDISNVKTDNDVVVKSVEIFSQIKQWAKN